MHALVWVARLWDTTLTGRWGFARDAERGPLRRVSEVSGCLSYRCIMYQPCKHFVQSNRTHISADTAISSTKSNNRLQWMVETPLRHYSHRIGKGPAQILLNSTFLFRWAVVKVVENCFEYLQASRYVHGVGNWADATWMLHEVDKG